MSGFRAVVFGWKWLFLALSHAYKLLAIVNYFVTGEWNRLEKFLLFHFLISKYKSEGSDLLHLIGLTFHPKGASCVLSISKRFRMRKTTCPCRGQKTISEVDVL